MSCASRRVSPLFGSPGHHPASGEGLEDPLLAVGQSTRLQELGTDSDLPFCSAAATVADRLPSGDSVVWQDWLPAVLSFKSDYKELPRPIPLPIPLPVRLTGLPAFFQAKLFPGKKRQEPKERRTPSGLFFGHERVKLGPEDRNPPLFLV